MGVAFFVKKAKVEIDQREYQLTRMIGTDTWQLEDQRTGEFIQRTTKDLLTYLGENRLMFVNDLENNVGATRDAWERKRDTTARSLFTTEELDVVKNAVAYVKAVQSLPTSEKLMVPAIEEVWKELGSKKKPPHWTTVARWKKRYIHFGNNGTSLKARNHRKGNRDGRYAKEVLEIVDDAIENVYLKRERNTVEDTLNNAIVQVDRLNRTLPSSMQMPHPTLCLVRSHIERIDAFDCYAARYGHLAATRKFRSVLHINVTDRPLECAEIDHTKLDLIVVDDASYMPLGRPYVTICIDRDSRCVLGIYVGFEPCSFYTVARCLKHAFCPKIMLRETYPEIENEWISFGIMEKLVVDNGPEFHSESLEYACYSLGIDLQYTPRKTPWWKGVVERFIGTMNRGVAHGNPGTTFEGILEKDDYDALKNAVITLSTLKKILNMWIVDVYHQKPHRALDGVTPAAKWGSSMSLDKIPVSDGSTNLDAILGTAEERVLTHKGIEYEGLFYNSPKLTDLRRRLGDKLDVEIRVDEGDLGHLHVIAPDKSEIISVPCLDQEYAKGLSKWQHKLCKRYATEKLNLSNNSNSWRHAKEKIREIVQEEIFSKKKRTRSKAKRFAGETSSNAPTSATAQPPATNVPTEKEVVPVADLIKRTTGRIVKNFTAIIENRKGV